MSEPGASPDALFKQGAEMAEKPSGLNLPSVEEFPLCINCIYSFEDGEDCHRHPEIGDNGIVCGDGVFAIGEVGNRCLVGYRDWWETAIVTEGTKS